MDPSSILTLSGDVLQLMALGKELAEAAKQIHHSPVSATVANENFACCAKRTQELSQAVQIDKPRSRLTEDEKRLCDAAVACGNICTELEKEMSKLGWGRKKGCAIVSLYFALRSWFARDKVKELDARLWRCEGQIHTHLLRIIQSDMKTQFVDFTALSEDNWAKISDSLRRGLKVSSLDEAVLRQLGEILQINDSNALRQRQNQILNAVRFDNMNDRFVGVSNADEATFQWIFEKQDVGIGPLGDDQSHCTPAMREAIVNRQKLLLEVKERFVQWLEATPTSSEDAVFHVLGKPGAGKSTLMKFLLKHNKTKFHLQEWSRDKTLVVASFFFWKPGSDPQKSQRGLVRALLHSILSQARDLIPNAFPIHWKDTQLRNNLVNLEQHEIEDAFNAIIRHPQTYASYRFGFFIDGMDEFEDQKHHKSHQYLVSLILGWVKESKGCIKIIASSRPIGHFVAGFEKSLRIRLQDLTLCDLETVVARRLAKVQDNAGITSVDDSILQNIKTRVLEKADGVFLWVTLVLNNVEAGIMQGDSWYNLEKKIDSLPTELQDLLQRIISDINPSDRIKALQTFSTVRYTDELGLSFPLSMYLLWDDVVSDPEVVSKLSLSNPPQEQIENRLAVSKRRVYCLFKGLLEVASFEEGSYINFTHRSVVETLEQLDIEQEISKSVGKFDIGNTILQCFLGYVKTIGISHDMNDFNHCLTIITWDHLRGTYEHDYPGHRFQRPDASGFCDSVDQLLEYIEAQEEGRLTFPELEQAAGDEEVSGLSPPVQLVIKTMAERCIYEYVSRHKRGFSKAMRALNAMPATLNEPWTECQRWLKMIQLSFDGKLVLPKDASNYLTNTFSDHITETALATWDKLSTREVETSRCRRGFEITTAILLAYILHGGYMGVSIKLEPDEELTQRYALRLLTNTHPEGYTILMDAGKRETLLLTPVTDGISPTLGLQDIAEMLLSGRTLAKLREIIYERRKYHGLDDWQAGLRLQAKFGTVEQIWRECVDFDDEDGFTNTIRGWALKWRKNPGWKPPAWKPSED